MNWKDYPHLFANGKFLCALPHFINLRIEMYDTLANMYCLSDVKGWHKISDCTLIARKIEDMTDEEWQDLFNTQNLYRDYYTAGGHVEQLDYEEMERIAIENLTIKGFIYLLSIGVYPFDQSHFENGTVININSQSE